ncbi:MAG TPA: hypothetical protein VMY06_09835 [Sedimentisphaerales bacterium]|nr:hypothetical protein [Sedimentisphaerales bacterium]
MAFLISYAQQAHELGYMCKGLLVRLSVATAQKKTSCSGLLRDVFRRGENFIISCFFVIGNKARATLTESGQILPAGKSKSSLCQ